MADATVPVKMTSDEQRQYLILSLKLLKAGAEKQKQRITPDMVSTGSVQPIDDHKKAMEAKAGKDGTGYEFKQYDNNQDTNGYSKADLEGIKQALATGDVDALKRYNIDVEQLKTGGQLDPAKVAVMTETVDILATDFNQAKTMETQGEGGTVAVHITGYVRKYYDREDYNGYLDTSTATPLIGSASYSNNTFLTGKDLDKAIQLVEGRKTIAELAVVAPGDQSTVGFIGARFAKRLTAPATPDNAEPSVGGMITRFANQRDVDAQLTRFIDVLLVGMKTKGPLDEAKLQAFAAIFDSKTPETDLQKLSDDLGIPLETIQQWRKDPEVKQLGQGFALCLHDHHQSGNMAALFPDADNAKSISAKDLLALKAGILDTTPPALDTDPELDDKAALAADLAYRGRVKTTVADVRKQIVKQGYVRANLIDTQMYTSPYAGTGPSYVASPASYGGYQNPMPYYNSGFAKGDSFGYYSGGGTMIFNNDYAGSDGGFGYTGYNDFSLSGFNYPTTFGNGPYGGGYDYVMKF